MLASLFRRLVPSEPSPEQEAATSLYAAIVAQARQPEFFVALGVPDTVDGRFEVIMLHGAAVINRLKDQGEQAEAVNQAVFDALFTDVDDNLRELGVGDLRVAKKVKGMAESFHGRAVAFETALADPDTKVLEETIARNTYATAEPRADQIKAMAGYLRQITQRLGDQPLAQLLAGKPDFGPAPQGADWMEEAEA